MPFIHDSRCNLVAQQVNSPRTGDFQFGDLLPGRFGWSEIGDGNSAPYFAIGATTGAREWGWLTISVGATTSGARAVTQNSNGSSAPLDYQEVVTVYCEVPMEWLLLQRPDGTFGAGAGDGVWDPLPAASLNGGGFGGRRNAAVNGAFDLWPEGTSGSGNGYAAGLWELKFNAAQTWARVADGPAGVRYALAVNGNGGKITVAHYLPPEVARQFVGRALTVSLDGRLQGGTGDCDIVLFTADAYDDFAASTKEGEAVAAGTFSAGGYTRVAASFPALSDAARRGLEVRITSAGTADAHWRIAAVQIEPGDRATPYEPRGLLDDEWALQAFWQTSYARDVAPGTATNEGIVSLQPGASATETGNRIRLPWAYRRPMRAQPTITHYDSAGNAGRVTLIDGDTATDNQVPSTALAANPSESQLTLTSSDGPLRAHLVLDARY